MARKPKESPDADTEVIDSAPQDEAVESQRDETLGTEALAVDEPPPLYEQVGLSKDDERWKPYLDINDPVELAKKFKEQVETESERFERQLAERRQQWETTITNDPTFIQWRRHEQDKSTREPEPQTDPLAEWWKPPEVNRDLIAHWTEHQPVKDEAGNVIGYEPGWKKGAPAELVKAVEDYDLYQQKWRSEFHSDPRGKLMPLVENVARKIAQEQFNNFAQQYDEQQFFNSLEDINGQHAKYLFAHDQATQRVVTGLDGRPIVSDLGKRLFNDANQLYVNANGGLTKKQAFLYAQKALMGEFALEERRIKAEEEAAGKKHEDERLRTLDEGARRRPTRAGSKANPENTRNPAQTDSAIDLFRQQVERQGITEETFEEMFA